MILLRILGFICLCAPLFVFFDYNKRSNIQYAIIYVVVFAITCIFVIRANPLHPCMPPGISVLLSGDTFNRTRMTQTKAQICTNFICVIGVISGCICGLWCFKSASA